MPKDGRMVWLLFPQTQGLLKKMTKCHFNNCDHGNTAREYVATLKPP